MVTLKKILSGEILKNDFLRRNVRFLLLIFGLFFILVIIGSIGAFKVAKIQVLNKQITDLKENSVFLSAELMQLSLVNNVDEQVKRRDLGLNKLSKPPKIIEIKIEENKK